VTWKDTERTVARRLAAFRAEVTHTTGDGVKGGAMSELRQRVHEWCEIHDPRDLDWILTAMAERLDAHDAARTPEPAQSYGDKREAYAEQPTETSYGWLAECEKAWRWADQFELPDEKARVAHRFFPRLIAAAREGAMQTSQAYEQIVQLNKSLAAKEADLAAAATREEEAVGALSRLRSLLAAANAKAERLERERDEARASTKAVESATTVLIE
jgi:hypothetical protein